MRRAALALLLALTACDSGPVSDGSTGEAVEPGGTTGEEDAESSGGEESTGGGESSTGEAGWDGAAITLRTVEAGPNRSCVHACGASACMAAANEWQRLECDNAEAPSITCTCADDAWAVGTEPTHAVSECYRGVDVPAPSGFDADAIEQWGGGSCDDFCESAGLGECAWTQWVIGDAGCYAVDYLSQGAGLVLQYGDEMTVRTPFESEDGGRMRFVCEL